MAQKKATTLFCQTSTAFPFFPPTQRDAQRRASTQRHTSEMVWTYTPVLNECLQLLIAVAIGFAAAAAKLITPAFRTALQTFVFHVAMPLLVARWGAAL